MKKIALFFITLFTITSIKAQIGITSVAAPQQKEQKPVFDSTKNFLGTTNVQSYVGQILFVKPTRLPEYGYDYFKPIDYNPQRLGYCSHYGRNAEKSHYNTRYEDLAEKYFKVDSIFEKDYFSYIFYLTNTKDTSDRCCFIYSSNYEHTFPFIVLSHFNYLKERYIGKNYIIQSNFLHSTDIITGDSIIIKDDSQLIWTTKDLTIINNKYKNFAFVVKSGNMTSYVDVDSFERAFGADNRRCIYEKKEWDNLVKKYGLTMMKLVFDRKIKVGMPEKLLIYSWGKPEKINRSSYGPDQYVYGNQYVYVKDGKITAWN